MLKWYEQECEKEQNIIASRVRFARNWNEYVFPSRLSEKDGREMVRRLDEGLTDLSEIDGRYYEAVMLEDLDELERQVLADRRVINRASIKKKGPAELILYGSPIDHSAVCQNLAKWNRSYPYSGDKARDGSECRPEGCRSDR